jgi:hypothetical protein
MALFACSSTDNGGTTDGGTTVTDSGGNKDTGSNGGSDSGTDTGSTTDDGGGSCTLAQPTPQGGTCDTCAQSACCVTWNKCFGDTTCAQLAACSFQCVSGDAGTAPDGGDPIKACQENCAKATGVTQTTIGNLNTALQCIIDNCVASTDAGTLADGGTPGCQ